MFIIIKLSLFYQAAEVIRRFNLSMAIFAQGWTHESLDRIPEDNFLERFYAQDNTWWITMWPYLYSHPIKYAFETTFLIGADSVRHLISCYHL